MSPRARTSRSVPDPIASFFEELSSKGHEPLLHHASGTLRLDLQLESGIERWYLTMATGDLTVSHRNARADATIRMDRKLFEGMTKGTVNVTAALLRGVFGIEGDLGLCSPSFVPAVPRAAAFASIVPRAAEGVGRMSADLVKILDGNTFVVSDARATSRRR